MVSTLFAALLKAENAIGARAAIFRINSFSLRLDVLEVAAKWVWATYDADDKVTRDWDNLRVRLRNGFDLRNRLAHSDMVERGEGRSRTFLLQQPLLDFSGIDPKNLKKHVERRLEREVDYKTADGATFLFETLSNDIYKLRAQVEMLQVRPNKLAG